MLPQISKSPVFTRPTIGTFYHIKHIPFTHYKFAHCQFVYCLPCAKNAEEMRKTYPQGGASLTGYQKIRKNNGNYTQLHAD